MTAAAMVDIQTFFGPLWNGLLGSLFLGNVFYHPPTVPALSGNCSRALGGLPKSPGSWMVKTWKLSES